MLRVAAQLGPLGALGALCPGGHALRPQQTRFASQLRRRQRPAARMQLSPKVARPQTKPALRSTHGPFRALNRTSVPRSLQDQSVKSRDQSRNSPRKDAKWYKALRERRSLSSVSYGRRLDVKRSIAAVDDFRRFPLLPVIQSSVRTQALPAYEDIAPTPVQRLAIPALLDLDANGRRRPCSARGMQGMQQFLLAAETGSGKTLAYLLPFIDAIKRAEMGNETETKACRLLEPPFLARDESPDAGRPRAIILVPSAELVDQVGALAKAFSHTVKFRSALLSAAYSATVIRNRLFCPSGVDMVITTPHLLCSIAESDPNILSRVSHLAIDEADSLLDRSFSPLICAIIDKASPSLRQLVFCSATIPRSMDTYLRKRFPDIKRLVTPNIHAVPRRVQLGVVRVDHQPYRGNKDLACADTIWNIGRSAEASGTKNIIVFVNERTKALELSNYLASKGIDVIALHRDTADERQSNALATFRGLPSQAGSLVQGPKGERKLANTKVLVATDLGSRGIDTVAVRHVILYDVPHSAVDFLHRLGRTGRMGRRGRGIVLLGKGDRADVVKDVRAGMFAGQALV